jgi:pantoate--beta-alanine ligase
MQIIQSIAEMQSAAIGLRTQGKLIGLVPTMGALHEGHLSLLARAREQCDRVVVSLFVNPTQFDERSDLERYPRRERDDAALAAQAGADVLFAPSVEEVYPPGFATSVEVLGVTERLEGAARGAEHFRGVATVVTKLLCMATPDAAYFGQKDAQQVVVIRRLARDLDLPVRIEALPTVREADGLAMSSRNRYLSAAERQQALSLSRALDQAEQMVRGGERNAKRVAAIMNETLQKSGIEKIDYAVVADPDTLAELNRIDRSAVALIAAHVGSTRLIDNRILAAAT